MNDLKAFDKEVLEVVNTYTNKLSLAELIGCLECIKQNIYLQTFNHYETLRTPPQD